MHLKLYAVACVWMTYLSTINICKFLPELWRQRDVYVFFLYCLYPRSTMEDDDLKKLRFCSTWPSKRVKYVIILLKTDRMVYVIWSRKKSDDFLYVACKVMSFCNRQFSNYIHVILFAKRRFGCFSFVWNFFIGNVYEIHCC